MPFSDFTRAVRTTRPRSIPARTLPFLGALGALSLSVVACSVDSGNAPLPEDTGSASSAFTENATAAFGVNDFPLSFLISELQSAQVSISTQGVSFTMRPEFLTALNLTQQPAFALPALSVTTSDVSVNVLSLTGSVDMSTFNAQIVGDHIVASVRGSAQATVMLTYAGHSITPTLSAPEIDVSLALGWNSTREVLVVEPHGVTVTMPGADVSGCGVFGWCNGIANSHLNDLTDAAGGALAQALTNFFDPPPPAEISDATTMFRLIANQGCERQPLPPPTPQGSGPWFVADISLANSLVNCQLIRDDNLVPMVIGVSPSTGAPGDTVTVHGSNINENGIVSVLFGSVPATNVQCQVGPSSEDCYVTVPAGTGTVDVRVIQANGVETPVATSDQFHYAPVAITSIVAKRGASTGGTSVQVWGSGFVTAPQATTFMFGDVPAAGSNCPASTMCILTSPAVTTPGPVHITATANGATSIMTAADIFTYGADAHLGDIIVNSAASGRVNSTTVWLDSYAPSGGATIALSSSDTSFMAPTATVTIPAGASNVTFFPGIQVGILPGSANLTATYLSDSSTVLVHQYCAPAKCYSGRVWDGDVCACVLAGPLN